MNKFFRMSALLATTLAIAAPGCKKKDEVKADDNAAPAAAKASVKTEATPKEVPEQPAVANADLATKFSQGWKSWNDRDEAGFLAFYGDKSTVTQADMKKLTGKEAILANSKDFWTAFPDMKGEGHLVLVNGDNLASLIFMSGTNTGAMKLPDGTEMPATGKAHSGYGIQSFNNTDPANVQETDFWDMGVLMGQITGAEGVRPAAESTGMVEEAPVVATGSEIEKANLAVFEKHLADFNSADPATIAAGYSTYATFSFTGAPMDMKGTEQITAFLTGFKGAFPDIKVTSTTHWAAGDYVYLHGTVTGKNSGAMPPMIAEPTNKDMKLELAEIYKIKDGKITHQWAVANGMAMAMQLGLMGEKK